MAGNKTITGKNKPAAVLLAITAIRNNKISDEWADALESRMDKSRIDSFKSITRELTVKETAWQKLIESKLNKWNSFRDSLAIPFQNIVLHDTIYVLLGYLGNDDGFTFRRQTVCLDLTALQNAYGDANLPENDNRVDRIYAHEYTHLLHKEWALKNKYEPSTFKDSILWECLYEGIGMYRSLNPKWLPVNGTLPTITTSTLEDLCAVFTERLIIIESGTTFTEEEKVMLQANLSRGQVNKKWGAFPVAIWLSLEAEGKDENLIYWINKGPEAVIHLAAKYLSGKNRETLQAAFKTILSR